MNELVELRQRVAEEDVKGLITLHNIRAVPRNPQRDMWSLQRAAVQEMEVTA
jgi:hypothetical protein